MSRGKKNGKGGLFGIIVLVAIAAVVMGGNRSKTASSTTRSFSSVETMINIKEELITLGDAVTRQCPHFFD